MDSSCDDDDDDDAASLGSDTWEQSSYYLDPCKYHPMDGMPIMQGLVPTAQSNLSMMMVMDIVVRRARDPTPYTEALLIGRCDDGLSGCVCVRGWYPYLYVRAPQGMRGTPDVLDTLRGHLDAAIGTYFATCVLRPNALRPKRSTASIRSISVVAAKSIYGYSHEDLSAFLKLEVVTPDHLEALRDVLVGYPLEGGGQTPGAQLSWSGQLVLGEASETFNSSLDAVQQFMVDVGVSGCQWVRVVAHTEALEPRRSHCAHEWHVGVEELRMETLDAAHRLAPLRVLSFDIEAAGRRGVFPQAAHDPVIQIALYFQVLEQDESPRPILLSLKACDAIEGAHVVSFDDEGDLLRAFRDIVVAFDADVFTGFNILNFDFPYLHDRAAALSRVAPRDFAALRTSACDDSSVVTRFDAMTRVRGASLYLRETEYVSAQTGKRKRTRVSLPGRVCIDMLIAIQNVHRLESYSLKACAEHFLQTENKVDLPFTQITPKWNEGPAGRRELGVYCLKDAELPLLLNAKVSALLQTIEMARATGVPFDAVLQRGVLVRNTSLLLRHASPRGFVFPNLSPHERQAGYRKREAIGRRVGYTGATVLDPECGMHAWVGVLDFSAMYPSIIAASNLCYSTIVLDPQHPFAARVMRDGEVDDEAGVLRIDGCTYVTPKHQRGVLPDIVMHLQSCRNKAKAALKHATDAMERQVLDARQQAFKVAANGMYGALASPLSLLPLEKIARSVTATGRLDLLQVRRMALDMYPDATVVYGDTDSVFVRLPLSAETEAASVARASEMTIALADRINAVMRPPKSIAFEKVLSIMLLLTKKRYAALMYKAGFDWRKDERPELLIKGLQSVRRDGCALVRDLVREVIASILGTGSDVDAAAMVRQRLVEVLEDKVSVEDYSIRKTLRKTYADCCKPMTRSELCAVRRAIGQAADDHGAPLTYAEEDAAIMAKVRLPYRQRIRLPHVNLAWRLRLKDPGSAPVPGEAITYVVTCNGGGRAGEKVETPDAVVARHIPVDREYYVQSLRVPMEAIFGPIAAQRLRGQRKHSDAAVAAELDQKLWSVLRGRRFSEAPEAKRARIEHSPIAMAFAGQRDRVAD